MICNCAGSRHIVCSTVKRVPLRATWRKLAPWMSDYGTDQYYAKGDDDVQTPNKPNLKPPAKRQGRRSKEQPVEVAS